MWTVLNYLYRDAGNFKAFGSIALDGALDRREQRIARACFYDDGLFIAEQIDVPALYAPLYKWSGGPTRSDHCWHEFVEFQIVSETDIPLDACRWGTADAFLQRLRSIEAWEGERSPHFKL